MAIPTILWILIIFLAIRILFRWLMPLLLPVLFHNIIKKQVRKFEGATEENIFNPSRNGKVNATKSKVNSESSSKKAADEGDYIDYEEL